MSDGVVLDYADDGTLVGIDIQHASTRADIHSMTLQHLPVLELRAA